jgi:hypothetical protein
MPALNVECASEGSSLKLSEALSEAILTITPRLVFR